MKKLSIGQLREIKEEGVAVVLSGLVLNLTISLLLSFGSYAAYLALMLGFSAKKFALVFPLMYITANAMIPLGNKLVMVQRFRGTMCGLMLLLAVVYAVLPTFSSLGGMAAALVLLVAVPTGAFYTVSAQCAIKYFPSEGAKVNSLLQFGQGIGCVLISYAAFKGCNPNNRPVDMNPTWKYNGNDFEIQGMFSALAAMLAISAAFIYAYIRYPKALNSKLLLDYQIMAKKFREDEKKKAATIINFQDVPSTASVVPKETEQPTSVSIPAIPAPIATNHFAPASECVSFRVGLLSKDFLLLALATTITTNGFWMMSSYKIIGLMIDAESDRMLTIWVCIGFLLFGVLRLAMRGIIEKLGFRLPFAAMLLLNLVPVFGYILYPQNCTVFCVGLAITLFVEGGLFTWFTLYATKLFGYRHASKFIQLLLVIFAIGSFFLHLFADYYELAAVGKLLLGVHLLSAICYRLIRQDKIWPSN